MVHPLNAFKGPNNNPGKVGKKKYVPHGQPILKYQMQESTEILLQPLAVCFTPNIDTNLTMKIMICLDFG
jgi:hypothetical protein